MTVLVTGASGLVGARLVPRLTGAGLACRLLLRAGRPAPAGTTRVEADLLDPASLPAAMQGVSAIIHLAAVFRGAEAGLIWASNLEGTRNLVAAARARAPGARFILASTSNIYDADTPHPAREADAATPLQAYPASKLAAEAVLRDSGLAWSVLRLGFVYGEADGHLQALPGLATRFGLHPALRMSLVHHRDIATATRLALSGAMDGRVVNIADEAPTSLYELAGLVGQAMPPSAAPLENPWRLQMDVSLARRLGFRPVVRTVHQAAEEGLL
ncbi:NAD(P)-dependent oxidoreductase [Pseudoroseomonas cervicalis]|uniref:NAD-dependent epimerase/dehydratase family protein n=1 Tax=Teichococcus cervicalis TaxID=204525 RepID=UPI0027804EF4|nr:NAD(P)-dependent oxidoreductase [Pseudoroseomonas cervicalis]MDQ1079672.1 UDP-glucose 4-epimerase [Pseudoroseomonas cervicalis]